MSNSNIHSIFTLILIKQIFGKKLWMAVPESRRQFCPRITPGQICKKYTNQAKSILFIWTTKLNNKKLTQHVQLFLCWICFSVPGRKEKTKLKWSWNSVSKYTLWHDKEHIYYIFFLYWFYILTEQLFI